MDVGRTESLISPQIYQDTVNNKMPQFPPIVAVGGGLGGRGAGSGVAGAAAATPVFDEMGSKIPPGPQLIHHEYKLCNKLPCAAFFTVCRLWQFALQNPENANLTVGVVSKVKKNFHH